VRAACARARRATSGAAQRYNDAMKISGPVAIAIGGVAALLGALPVACGGSTSDAPSGATDASSDAIGDSRASSDAAVDSGALDGDAGSDASTDGSLVDVSTDGPPVDAGDFFSILPGIWLVGWSGGLNHYSWVRIDPGGGTGAAEYLPGTELQSNAPYWSCSGSGTWTITQKPNTVLLMFPAVCNIQPMSLTFDSFYAPGTYPKNANLGARISTNPPTQPLDGWRFPPNQCDGQMASCTNPF
jgi:hypothetical protein